MIICYKAYDNLLFIEIFRTTIIILFKKIAITLVGLKSAMKLWQIFLLILKYKMGVEIWPFQRITIPLGRKLWLWQSIDWPRFNIPGYNKMLKMIPLGVATRGAAHPIFLFGLWKRGFLSEVGISFDVRSLYINDDKVTFSTSLC